MRRSRLVPVIALVVLVGLAVPGAARGGARPHLRIRSAPRPGIADFNGDGIDDLAIGAIETAVNGHTGAGAVHVLYGSTIGLTAAVNQRFTEATAGIPGTAGNYDEFGYAVAVGDCNDDGFSDLAIGAPGDPVGTHTNVGTITLLLGSAEGLDPSTAEQVDERAFGGTVESSDRYGSALAFGDFNGNGTDDLAVGGPEEGVTKVQGAGAVGVLSCTKSGGLPTGGGRLFTENHFSHHHVSTGANFGAALATGGLTSDAFDDLVVGAPFASDGAHTTGAVAILYGSASGIDGGQVGSDFDASALDGVASAEHMHFGVSLAVGDVMGDGSNDVAVGASGEAVNGHTEAGAVHVMRGRSTGPNGTAPALLTEDSVGAPNPSTSYELFGSAVAIGDVGNGSRADLVASAPQEVLGTHTNAGAVLVLYGGTGTAGSGGVDQIARNTTGVPGNVTTNDYWTIGGAVHVANLGNGGIGDLAIGDPQDAVAGLDGVGSVVVLYGRSAGVVGGTVQQWTVDSTGVQGDHSTCRSFGQSLS
jgi:FG-GAP repeat